MTENNWKPALQSTALALRIGLDGMSGESLSQFIDKLIPELTKLPPELIASLQEALAETLAAQYRNDNIRVADLLEYEIAPILDKFIQ